MKIEMKIQNDVISDYIANKLKIYEIANKYDLCRQSIRHIILHNKLPLKEKRINHDVEKQIIEGYLKGETNKNLAKNFKLHRATIQRTILRNGLKLKTLEETSRKHKIDEKIFNKIDNQFKAYFLGLGYADGNLSRNCMEISLIHTDKQILEDISKEVYGKIVLGERASKRVVINGKKSICNKQSRFRITSKKIANDFRRHGLVENKTFTIRLPKLNRELYKDFIRGYFDGDGCIHISKNKGNNRIMIVSNPKFGNDLKILVEKFLKIRCCDIKKTNTVNSLNIYGNKQVKKFLDWIYDEVEIKLERKYQKYLINYT